MAAVLRNQSDIYTGYFQQQEDISAGSEWNALAYQGLCLGNAIPC